MNPTIDTLLLWVALNLSHRTIHRKTNLALKAAGLPALPWFDVLWELDRAADGVRPQDLDKILLFEQSNLSRLLKKMEAEKMIVQTPFKQDKRGKIVKITPKGTDLRKRMWQVYGAVLEDSLGEIPDNFDIENMIGGMFSLVDPEISKRFGWRKN